MEPAKIKAKTSTTMFEVNDEGKDAEYGRWSGSVYNKPFAEWLQTLGLGYGVVLEDGLGYVEIDGVRLNIDTDNASYKSKNGWSREVSVRKPQNRFIRLLKGNEHIIKIHFNKEYETEKLRKAILKAIQEVKDSHQEIAYRKDMDRLNTTAIAMHFINRSDCFKKCSYIRIEKGIIEFMLPEGASLYIDTDNKVLKFNQYAKEVNQSDNFSDELFELSKNSHIIFARIREMITYITCTDQLSEEMKQWAKGAYYKTFNVSEMKYDEY